jgi:hypothetical protein
VLVILGGDTPLGAQLSASLAAAGFIVLATVESAVAQATFSRQVRPSSQGYVKAVVLDPSHSDPQGSIRALVSALASATELRWPLTSAGDPYAKTGEHVRLAGVINALSWVGETNADALSESASAHLERHVALPLDALTALLPMLRTPGDARAASQPVTLISLVAPAPAAPGPAAMVRAAVLEGMRALAGATASRKGARLARFATLQVAPVSSELVSQPRTPQPRRTTINARGEPLPSRHSSAATPSAADDEASRLAAHCSRLMLSPASARIAAFSVVRSSRGFMLHRAFWEQTVQLRSMSLLDVLRQSPSFLLGTSRSFAARIYSSTYSLGERIGLLSSRRVGGPGAPATRRPAFGPGPGPVSNSHSRTSIGRNLATNASSSTMATRRPSSSSGTRRAARPRSAHSATSSGEEQDASGSSAGGAAGLESSGLLSSVPSSAFGDGDASSPPLSSRGMSSPPWGATATPPMRASDETIHASDYSYEEGSTPGASRVVSGSGPGASFGFDAQSSASSPSMEHVEGTRSEHSAEGPWMGPPSREAASPRVAAVRTPAADGGAARGFDSPLGQSWVKLGESQSGAAPQSPSASRAE